MENRITKKSNLIQNDSLSSFDGHAAQQSDSVYEVFYNFLISVKPARILEIGTALGGFTTFLNIISKENNLNINIRTYDIHENDWYHQMIQNGIDVRVENIFSDDYQKIDNEVINYIQGDGTTIILCDGGNKIGEFNILSNYLKRGDFILAHDYAEDISIFNEKIKYKIWNWCEIMESDICDAAKRNNLIDYNKEIFNSSAWVCKIKK